MAIRRWPSSIRWRVAERPPDQFVAPTKGTSSGSSVVGSKTTNGIPLARNWSRCSPGELGHGHDAGGAPGDGVIDPVVNGVALRAELGQHHSHVVLPGDPLDPAVGNARAKPVNTHG
jgi:hypothetical protein